MRRRTPGVQSVDELIPARIARAETHDAARVIRLLEPLVSERRRARLLEVIGLRLSSVSVVFDAPHDPHNGAAVVRSCEAFGVHTLHVVEKRERFLSATSVSRSAEKWVRILCHKTAGSAIDAVRAAGLEMVATRPDGELLPHELAKVPRLALVLGNEREGIGAELEAACTRSARVPMRGFVESLNVSVTAAILLSAATTGRAGDLEEAERLRLYARGLFFSVPRAEEVL
jgi:tRNA (guanosine-2'-O-)-methyltransferase